MYSTNLMVSFAALQLRGRFANDDIRARPRFHIVDPSERTIILMLCSPKGTCIILPDFHTLMNKRLNDSISLRHS